MINYKLFSFSDKKIKTIVAILLVVNLRAQLFDLLCGLIISQCVFNWILKKPVFISLIHFNSLTNVILDLSCLLDKPF